MWKHTNAPQIRFTGDEMVVQNYKGKNIVKRKMSKEEARNFLVRMGEDEYNKNKVIDERKRLEIGNPTEWMGRLVSFGQGTVAEIKKKKLEEVD